MTTTQLEEAICNQYDNGRYSPHGADGGCMKYIGVIVYDKEYWASITLDHEVAQIRRIWELKEVERKDSKYSYKKIYDYRKTYYSLRDN